MKEFAKIFQSKKYGQIVVMKKPNDEGNPEVRFFVCMKSSISNFQEIAFSYDEWKDGEKKRNEAYRKVDQDAAEKVAAMMIK